MKGGEIPSENETPTNTFPYHKLSELLSYHKEFSKVFLLSSLLDNIKTLKPLFKNNYENIISLIKSNEKTKSKYLIDDFDLFCSKSIICFPAKDEFNYKSFLTQINNISSIDINTEITILNLLADASTYCKDINNLIQFTGLKSFNIIENNFNLLKIFSNRLINTKNFEYLRLLVGDWILSFIFKFCSMFVYDLKSKNYIQILGNNFKSVMTKLISVPRIDRVGTNNFYFTKVFSSIGNSTFYTQTQYQKNTLPIAGELNFTVERTKIYYCSNFNRKLGYFRNLKITPLDNFQNIIVALENNWKNNEKANSKRNKAKKEIEAKTKTNSKKLKNKSNENNFNSNTVISKVDLDMIKINNSFPFVTYNKLFPNKVNNLLPVEVRVKILSFLNYITIRIKKFNYSKELFNACPMMKNWKEIKKDIKQKLKDIEQTKGNQDKKLIDELMEQLKQLINTNIHYDNIFKFVKNFLKFILPIEMLGPKNNKVLFTKTIDFIKMNRFETFNKLNLFSNKEFSFNEMKWLKFNNFSKKKYCEIGILLKNFVMKTLIHWIFNFLLVQLFRSHFFVTEKQGEHFKSLYYHKIIYDLIIKICYDKYIYITNQYQKTTKAEAFKVLATIDSAPGKLRLMPKASTMRPITSFKKKTLGQNQNFLKNKLFDTQKIFKYIQNKMQGDPNNCVVFDYKEIMKRLINFKTRINNTSENSKMFKGIINTNNAIDLGNNKIIKSYLNYITMDIEACYDNINIDLLNKFLDTDDTISPTYVTGILYVLIPKVNKIKEEKANDNQKKIDIKDCFDIKLLYMVSDLNEFIHMLDYIRKSDDIAYQNCIIYLDDVNGVNFKSKAQFIPTVRNIINNNFIKFNRSFLKQTNGIPQGLSVSSFLCNLFFYEIEKELSCYIQKEINNNQSLLLRFMDDYLCLSNGEEKANEFKNTSVELSHKNKFNFNMKKMQANIGENIENKENLSDDKDFNFTWNGIFFKVSNKNYFNLVYDLKLRGDEELSEYSKLINVNLPILKDETDYSWFIKKINSVLFSGHPWIYFMNKINSEKILEINFKNLLKFIFFKVIVLIRKVENTSIQPSQNKLITILDTCIIKLYSFLDNKIYEIEGKHFFIAFDEFHKKFYCEFFRNYFINTENNKLNSKIISYSPLLFKTIKRKIEKFRLVKKVDVIQNSYETIKKQLNSYKKKKI